MPFDDCRAWKVSSAVGGGTKTAQREVWLSGLQKVCVVQTRLAHAPPRFFVLQLAWQRLRESPQDIRDTLAAIQEVRPLPHLLLLTARLCPGCRHVMQ